MGKINTFKGLVLSAACLIIAGLFMSCEILYADDAPPSSPSRNWYWYIGQSAEGVESNFLGAGSLSLTAASFDDSTTLDSPDPGLPNSTLPTRSASEIQDAIDRADPRGRVEIEPGIYVFASDLNIAKDVILVGENPDTTVFVLGEHSILIKETTHPYSPRFPFSKSLLNVTIEGVAIIGHDGTNANGPIENYSKELTLRNCKIILNRGIKASAIYTSYRTHLFLDNVLIAENVNVSTGAALPSGIYSNSTVHCGTIYLDIHAVLEANKSTIADNVNASGAIQNGYGQAGYGLNEINIDYGAVHRSALNEVTVVDSIIWNNGNEIESKDFSYGVTRSRAIIWLEQWLARRYNRLSYITHSDIQQEDVPGMRMFDVVHIDPEFDPQDDDYRPGNDVPLPENMGAELANAINLYSNIGLFGTEKPVAEFSGTPRRGFAPLDVTFTNNSTGAALNYIWDFGDGKRQETALRSNVIHRYETVGIYTVSLTAEGGAGYSDKETKTNYITVEKSPNRPPVLNTIGTRIVSEGNLLEFTVSATDPDGDVLTYSASNLPQGSSFNRITRIFSWRPAYDQAGTYRNVHFEVRDASFTDFEDIIITVWDTDRPPVLDPIGNKEVREGEHLEFAVSASDPDGTSVTISATPIPLPAFMAFDGRTFTADPRREDVGSYSITFNAISRNLYDSETITITVIGADVNRPPVAEELHISLDEDTRIYIQPIFSDPDGDPLTFEIVAEPLHGRLIRGRFLVYIPNADYHGPDAFAFRVSDGELYSHVAGVFITVDPVNDPLYIVGDIEDQIINEGDDFNTIDLNNYVEDVDFPDEEIRWNAVYDDTNINVAIDGGIATVTYESGWTGSETVVFIATDSGGATASTEATFTVTTRGSWDFEDLKRKIERADAGDELEIPEGSYIFTSDLNITKDIILAGGDFNETVFILGEHHVIIKDPNHRYNSRSPFSPNLTNVTIEEVTITGRRIERTQTAYGEAGYMDEEDFGPVQNYAAKLTLNNCRIVDNEGIKVSAIYTSRYSELYLKNTVISDNINIPANSVLPYGPYQEYEVYCGTIYLGGYTKLYVQDSRITDNIDSSRPIGQIDVIYNVIYPSYYDVIDISPDSLVQ